MFYWLLWFALQGHRKIVSHPSAATVQQEPLCVTDCVKHNIKDLVIIMRIVDEKKDVTCNTLSALHLKATDVTNEKEFLIPTYKTFK